MIRKFNEFITIESNKRITDVLYKKFENNRKRRNYIEEMRASSLALAANEEKADTAEKKEA